MASKETRTRSHPNWVRAVAITVAVVFVLGSFITYAACQRDDIAAVVNGQRIYRQQVVDELTARHGRSILDELVEQTVLRQQARTAGVSIPQERVDREFDSIRARFGSDLEFETTLSQYGMTADELRRRLETDLLIEALVVHHYGLEVTDEQALDYYEKNIALFTSQAEAMARHILVSTEEEALEIIALLREGSDFSELAAERSEDPGSAESGGDLGVIHRGDMVEEFDEAVFTLPVGSVSEPVATTYGYHVILVDQRTDEAVLSFEQVSEEARTRALGEQARTLMGEWLDALMTDSQVDYRVDWR